MAVGHKNPSTCEGVIGWRGRDVQAPLTAAHGSESRGQAYQSQVWFNRHLLGGFSPVSVVLAMALPWEWYESHSQMRETEAQKDKINGL